METRVADRDRSAAAAAPPGAMRDRPDAGESRAGTTPSAGLGPAPGTADRRTHTAPNAPRRARGPLYAALDLGTNNCRLLIARPHENSFRVLDGFLLDDHVPKMDDDSDWNHRGRAHAIGYMQGLIRMGQLMAKAA